MVKRQQELFFLPEAKYSTLQRTQEPKDYAHSVFAAAHSFWKNRGRQISYDGQWKEQVLRSALALKLLMSSKFGSLVAAATFLLPEVIGGKRNWDYRYTWVRDAAFTTYVFMELKLHDEAGKFVECIKQQCSDAALQLIYAVDGSKDLDKKELTHPEGYKKSAPVRNGNDVYRQLQIVIYGELLDTVYIFVRYARHKTIEFWEVIVD